MGGSFIGYELAEGVSFRKKAKLTWIMRGPWFLRYVLDAEGGQLCRQMGEAQEVEFITSDEVQSSAGTTVNSMPRPSMESTSTSTCSRMAWVSTTTPSPARTPASSLNKGIVTDAKLRTRRRTCTRPVTWRCSLT